MKTQKLTLVCLMCLIAGSALAGTGEIKDKVLESVSAEAELELLQEFMPKEALDFKKMNLYKIYDANYELILEGQLNLENDIENEELIGLINKSEFLLQDNHTFIYQLEK